MLQPEATRGVSAFTCKCWLFPSSFRSFIAIVHNSLTRDTVPVIAFPVLNYNVSADTEDIRTHKYAHTQAAHTT